MLETSIFSFSHNVFYSSKNKFHIFSRIFFVVCNCFQFRQPKILLFGKFVKFFTKQQMFRLVELESICRRQNKCDFKIDIYLLWEGKKILWEKEKMLVTSIFSFSLNVFKRLLFYGWDYVIKS